MSKNIKRKDLNSIISKIQKIISSYSREEYMRKQTYANNKMIQNAKIDTLTTEQHNALIFLCSTRHKLHININNMVKGLETSVCIQKQLIDANQYLLKVELPVIQEIPTSEDDYIDIDSINLLENLEESPPRDNEKEWQEWYDIEYSRIYDEWENLNITIEKYLEQIDRKYGTQYKPTGFSRKL